MVNSSQRPFEDRKNLLQSDDLGPALFLGERWGMAEVSILTALTALLAIPDRLGDAPAAQRISLPGSLHAVPFASNSNPLRPKQSRISDSVERCLKRSILTREP